MVEKWKKDKFFISFLSNLLLFIVLVINFYRNHSRKIENIMILVRDSNNVLVVPNTKGAFAQKTDFDFEFQEAN